MASFFPESIAAASDSESEQSGYVTGQSEYSTESLTSSIFKYRYENGRRYHAFTDEKYLLPNDETEQDRLDIVHHIFLILMENKLHLAPIGPNPQRILDIGTGTGIWAIDAGEKYPSAEVIGTDLSPIQPSWVPPNVRFEIDDAECEWTFKKNSFDLIHIRHLTDAISNWEKLFEQAYKHCAPGGWIDVSEYEMGLWSDDGTLPEDSELQTYYKLMHKAAKQTGRPYNMSTELKPLLEKAGFTNVVQQDVKIPLGPWAADKKQKEVGAYALLAIETGFEAYGLLLFTKVLEMDPEDAQHLIKAAYKQVKSKKIHSYSKHHLYYGQKPLKEADI